MNRELVQRWNHMVKPEDTVIHLGDFSWGDPRYWRDRLNGNLIHIRGNHDHGVPWEMHDYAEVRFGKDRFILFHYPIEEWNGFFRGTWHLHCHTHKTTGTTAKRRINVSVEAWDYAPINLSEIREMMK